jgi:putative thioredoxin
VERAYALSPMSANAHAIDVGYENFQAEVLEGSRAQPVLLDFWASWCEPCKKLTPILEKLAADYNGGFRLAKVDIDRWPELAQAFGVQSVPTVVLVKQGQIADGFMGLQPEKLIRELLARQGVKPPRDLMAAAREAQAGGDLEGAVALVREHLENSPEDVPARAKLAHLLALLGDVEGSELELSQLTEEELTHEWAMAARKLLDSRGKVIDLAPLEAELERQPESIPAHLALGRALIDTGAHERGMELLFAAAQRDLRFDDSAPRKALLEAFAQLGDENPLTLSYRRRLSVLLCS